MNALASETLRYATTDLACLAPGETAEVDAVDLDSPTGRRLLALGFVPGTTVRVVRIAPLRDPVEYELRGTRISLRASEARAVRIRTPDLELAEAAE